MTHEDDIDVLLRRLLATAEPSDARSAEAADHEALLNRARFHGVEALLLDSLQRGQAAPVLVDALRENVRARAAWEMQHRHLLLQVISEFDRRGVRALVFKGTALAYSLYSNAVMRARADTDVFVPVDQREAATEALTSLGFGVSEDSDELSVAYQACHARLDPAGDPHSIDLHWRFSNQEVLSRLFEFEELWGRRDALPRLARGISAPGSVDALLIACAHRAKHDLSPMYAGEEERHAGDRLIWELDIHLLAEALDDRQWQDFTEQALAKGLAAICLDGLERAERTFRTRIPVQCRDRLRATHRERVTRYLAAGSLRRTWMDVLAVPGLSGKLAHLRKLLLPPPAYMRHKYRERADATLPSLYLSRIWSGLLKSR